jgi:hypothetical protein
VIEATDIVRASLAGLGLGEVICAPGLADASAIARFVEAEAAVFGGPRGSPSRTLRQVSASPVKVGVR